MEQPIEQRIFEAQGYIIVCTLEYEAESIEAAELLADYLDLSSKAMCRVRKIVQHHGVSGSGHVLLAEVRGADTQETAEGLRNKGKESEESMTTANDFMRAAAEMDEIRVEMKPTSEDQHHDLRELICYHLLTAVKHARHIGESLAAREVAKP